MRYDDDMETARALCILFLPFRSELEDIHEKYPQSLVAENSSLINANREKFEKNQYIFDLIKLFECLFQFLIVLQYNIITGLSQHFNMRFTLWSKKFQIFVFNKFW